MFSDIVKLYDRNFIVGYIFPTILFMYIQLILLIIYYPELLRYVDKLGYIDNSDEYLQQIMSMSIMDLMELNIKDLQDFWSLFAILLTIWLLSILLTILNRELIRILEGYYLLNRSFLKRFPPKSYQLKKFGHIVEKIEKIEEHYDTATPEEMGERMKLMISLSNNFPYLEEHVLPTSFGNRIRAFETYSNKVYGFDAIPIWPRILLLLPEGAKKQLNFAKSHVDFAVNSIYLTAFILMEYTFIAAITSEIKSVSIPSLLILILIVLRKFALISALEWGEISKAILDVYSNTLLSQMSIKNPTDWDEKRKVWTGLSQVFIYRISPKYVNLEQEFEGETTTGKMVHTSLRRGKDRLGHCRLTGKPRP